MSAPYAAKILSMSLLQFDHFTKRYGSQLILHIDQLPWESGLHLIHGPNGCGKSTLLKSLAGLIPYGGKIMWENTWDLRSRPQLQRQMINYSEAEPVFPPFLRGRYLMELFLSYKNGHVDQQNRIQKRLTIGDYTEQKISTYSSGMKKKLALLLAFTGSPKLILLDEPFATLDKEAQRQLCDLISDYLNQGISFILTTHQEIPPALPDAQHWFIAQQSIHKGVPAS